MKIFDKSLIALDRALDVRSTKHQHLAHTLANVDTPGFRPSDVNFDETFQALLARDDALTANGKIPSLTDDPRADAVVERGAETAPTPDGNTVDLDRTMVALQENQLMYDVTTRLARKRLAILRYVVNDGVG